MCGTFGFKWLPEAGFCYSGNKVPDNRVDGGQVGARAGIRSKCGDSRDRDASPMESSSLSEMYVGGARINNLPAFREFEIPVSG